MDTHELAPAPQARPDMDRPLSLADLTFLDEGEQVTVGRRDIDSYCVLPADGAALLRRLAGGDTPRQAQQWYSTAFDETVDIDDFLVAMEDLGFVASPDAPRVEPGRIRWQRLGVVVFSPAALVVYALVVALAATEAITYPRLLPRYENLFFTRYLTVIMIVTFVGQFPLLLLHEAAHVLAGRRLGLRTRLSVGRRLYYVVFLTSLDGLVSVPRRRRYLPILAGILCDLVVVAVLTLLAGLDQRAGGTLGLFGGICLALALSTVLRVAWQFYLHLQTDLYHLVATATGCSDLHATARVVLRNRLNRTLRRTGHLTDESSLFPADRRVARWYSWMIVLGNLLSVALLVVVGAPTAWRVWQTMAERWGRPGLATGQLVDTIAFFTVNALQAALLVGVLLRERSRPRPHTEES